jgi:hypothetical protein
MQERGDGILPTIVNDDPEAALEWKGGVLVFTGEVSGDLTNLVEREREERLARLGVVEDICPS